jgi:hypothetical protein
MEGALKDERFKEKVPVQFWHPKQWDGSVDLILEPDPAAAELLAMQSLDRGSAAVAPELYLSGTAEQPRFGDNLKAEGRPDDYRQFSAFTYGYNPTLLARRVHDVSALVVMIRGDKSRPVNTVRIIAGSTYTAVALTSGALLKGAVDEVHIPKNGFRFEHITSHWDPDFMPGAVKYGDVDSLARLVGKLLFRP